MQVAGYNADNSYIHTYIGTGEFLASEISGMHAGLIIYDGHEYYISKISTNNVLIGCDALGSISAYFDVLNALGLHNNELGEATSAEACFTSGIGRIRLSTYNGGLSSQYMVLERTSDTPNDSYCVYYMVGENAVLQYPIGSGDNVQNHFVIPIMAKYGPATSKTYYFGVLSIEEFTTGSRIRVMFSDSITNTSYLQPLPSPGEKGFEPIKYVTKNTIGGGKHTGEFPGYTTDQLTQPGAPNESVASVIGTGFINVYKVDTGNLVKLGRCLFSSTWDQWISNVFRNPMDSLISLQIFPYTPDLGSAQPIKLLKYSCIATDLSEDVNAPVLLHQFKTIDFGTLTIPEMWQSFLDYEATNFELYLPFIGTVDIPVNEVMDGSVNVQYTIDFLTGMCVANVLCTKLIKISSGNFVPQFSQHSYMGNCAVQIPLTSESYGNIIGALAQASSVALTSGIAGAVGSLAMSAFSGGFKPTVETKGAITSNAGFCSVLYPYITITRPITAEPESYQEVMGYPSYIEATLGECEDLCICDNIDLSGVTGATESEMNRIKQLCKEGVYV